LSWTQMHLLQLHPLILPKYQIRNADEQDKEPNKRF
jgi:hypothetical protein